MPSDTAFEFGKDENGKPIKWTTSDIVVDSAGNEYIVRANHKTVRAKNNLYVEPIDKSNLNPAEDNRIFITEDEWRTQGWVKKQEGNFDISTTQLKPKSFNTVKV